MVPISRRRLLVAGGITAAAGCMSSGPERRSDDDTTTETSSEPDDGSGNLPESLVDALELLPAAVDGETPSRVAVIAPEPDGQYGESVADQFDLDPSTVDYGVAATYGERSGTIIAFSGSYDPAEGSVEDRGAGATVDGRFVATMNLEGDSGWDAGLDAARSAAEGSAESLADRDTIATALEPVVDEPFATVVPRSNENLDEGPWESVDADAVDAIASASTEVEERRRRITTVVVYEDESAVDTENLRAMTEDRWGDRIRDRTVEQDGRRGVATVVYERPPQPDREASPDAHFHAEYDDEAGEATVTHHGEEPVDAETLTVRVDGDPAAAQFADEYDTVDEGDSVTIDADPFSHVRVRWEDPDDEETFDRLGDDIAYDRSVFETDYDADASAVTITYTGEQPAETAPLELRHRRDDDEGYPDGTPLSEYHETLTAGDEVVVDDVSPGDRVSISATVDVENGSYGTSVVSIAVRPSSYFGVERGDGETRLVYFGGSSHSVIDASIGEYRVLVDGEPAATQFADEYDELSKEDAIEIDAELGAEVTVEWTGQGEPMELTTQVVTPDVEFAFERLDDGRMEIAHDGGEPVDAGELTVAIRTRDDPEADSVAWGETGETVEVGDSITVDVPEDARYVIVEYGDRGIAGERLDD